MRAFIESFLVEVSFYSYFTHPSMLNTIINIAKVDPKFRLLTANMIVPERLQVLNTETKTNVRRPFNFRILNWAIYFEIDFHCHFLSLC